MAVSYENSVMKSAFKDNTFKMDMWETHVAENTANYSIFDKTSGEYVGYCGIKNLTQDRWEIAIELLKKFHGKGYGYNALVLMFNALENLTGAMVYRSRVDSDNYASQGLMKKLGARPNGISEMFLHGDELIRFQEENKDLIDDRIIGVANEFGVEPIDLLGHVLEYRIEWEN
jgi:RimJ/RimL family protein N-acetyltransferase